MKALKWLNNEIEPTVTDTLTIGELIERIPLVVTYKNRKYALRYNNSIVTYTNVIRATDIIRWKKPEFIDNLYECYKWILEKNLVY